MWRIHLSLLMLMGLTPELAVIVSKGLLAHFVHALWCSQGRGGVPGADFCAFRQYEAPGIPPHGRHNATKSAQ